MVAASTNTTVDAINVSVAQAFPKPTDILSAPGMGAVNIGVGDIVKTRENNRLLGVLNGQHFVVRAVHPSGGLRVQSVEADRAVFELPADYVTEHVQLGYATTVHSAQGMTVDEGHLLVTGQTDGAGVYVGMTRGRTSNTAHFVAQSLEEAKEQFVAAVGRKRADMGLESHVQELENMLLGTEYKQMEIDSRYPVEGFFGELSPGDGLMYQNRKHLVVRAHWQKQLIDVLDPADGSKAKVTRLKLPRDGQGAYQPVSLVPGGCLPLPPTMAVAKKEAALKVQQAQGLKRFADDSARWVQNLENNPLLLEKIQQAIGEMEELTADKSAAADRLAEAQQVYAQQVKKHEQVLVSAQREAEHEELEYQRLGFFKKLVTSSVPRYEATRRLHLMQEHTPSHQPVEQAQVLCEQVQQRLVQVQEGLDALQQTVGEAPVLPGWGSARVSASGLIPADIAKVEQKMQALMEDAKNLLAGVEDTQQVVSAWEQARQDTVRKQKPSPSRRAASQMRPVAPVIPGVPDTVQGLNHGPGMGLGL